MVASIAIAGGSAVSVTAPAGWTQIARVDNDVNVALISYWKTASASDPASYTWTVDQQTRAVGGITPYSGVDTTNPIDTSITNYGYGNIASAPNVTTSRANEEVVALFATDVNKSFGVPAGMTEKYDLSQSKIGPATAADDNLQASQGTVATSSSTIAGNKPRNWAAQQIALRAFLPPFTLTPSSGPVFDTTISDTRYSVFVCDPNHTCDTIGFFSGLSDECAVSGYTDLAAHAGHIAQGLYTDEAGQPASPCDETIPGAWKVRQYLYNGSTFTWIGPAQTFTVIAH